MRYFNALSEEQLAELYLGGKGDLVNLPGTAAGLVEDVSRWLRASRMDHRLGEAAAIAYEVHRIAQQVRAQQAPEAEDNRFDVQQGHGNSRPDLELAMRQADEVALINRIRATSMADWGAERIRLGIAPRSQFDHLAGIAS